MTSKRNAFRWFVCCAALLCGCGMPLPSETPLGAGPLARRPGQATPPATAARVETPPPPAQTATAIAPAVSADAGPPPTKLAQSDAGAPGADAAPPKAEAPQIVFAGAYVGTDRATVKMPGGPPQTQNDPKARITVAESKPGLIAITLIDSTNGSTICTLSAKTQGNRADVAPGQACFGTGSPEVKSVVKSGTATVNGNRLTFDMLIEMELELEGRQAQGSIDYHFEGTRP